MKKKIVSLMLAVTLCISSVLVGCGSKEAPKTEGNKTESVKEETTTVKISAINAISWAPLFIAQTEGFFEKQGIEAEFTTPGGPKGFQAMHAGDCDFAMLSQEPLLIAQEQGMESTVVAATLKTRVYGLISTPDIKMHAGDCDFAMLSQEPLLIAQEQGMESTVVAATLKTRVYGLISTPDIKDITQLKGKTIFGSDPGSAPYTFISNVLSLSGLDPLKDVNFVQIGDNNAGLQAFLKGEVDAAFVNMYTLPVAGDFEYNILADCTKPDQCEKYLGSAEFPGEMLCTTKAFSEKNPETCQKVVDAVIDAQKWISEHTDDEVAASLKPVFGDIEEKVISEQVTLVRDEYALDCMVTEKGQKAVIDMCMKAGIISKEIPYDEIINMSFVKNHK